MDRNINAMLLEKDITILLEKGILIKTDSYVKDFDLNVYRFRDEKNYYYLNELYNKRLDSDLQNIFYLFYDRRNEFENRISIQIESSLPRTGLRLEILKKEINA